MWTFGGGDIEVTKSFDDVVKVYKAFSGEGNSQMIKIFIFEMM